MDEKENGLKNKLKSHGLSATAIRLRLLECFIASSSAMSHHELEKHIGGLFDRVTLYRTLKSFTEKGIIHEVFDNSATAKYALCPSCEEKGHSHHKHAHLHFKCVDCENIVCLDNAHILELRLPEAFMVQGYELLVTGICPDCKKK